MVRIICLGNCQAYGIAAALRFFVPNAFIKRVVTFEPQTLEAYPTIEHLLADMRNFDFVFMQTGPDGPLANGGLEAVRSQVKHHLEYPIITFAAYHPDLIYANVVSDGASGPLFTPLGAYNSALTLFGYKNNLYPREIESLFRGDVFERLGYFDFWDASVKNLTTSGEAVNMPLGAEILKWSRSGCFMHSINHAKIYVLADIARRLMQTAGLRPTHSVIADYIPDDTRSDAIWPVYPEIAERFGFKGGYTFQRPNYALQAGENPYLNLSEFIAGSVHSYKHFPQRDLVNERVERWLANKELTSFLLNSVR